MNNSPTQEPINCAPEQQPAIKTKVRPVPAHIEVGKLAEQLSMSKKFIKDRCKAGEMVGFRLGNRIVVSAESVHSFLQNRQIRPIDQI